MQAIDKLKEMAQYCGTRQTEGLSSQVITEFLKTDQHLAGAIDEAWNLHEQLRSSDPDFLKLPEQEQISQAQSDYVNFYDPYSINPYMAAAARGPWIISLAGAVIHDSGGYGMLGMGHSPASILEAMNQSHVMANIMTGNIAQKELAKTLRKEIGHSRSGTKRHPFSRFLCLNSGSEAVTVASRLSDIHADIQCNGQHKGKKVCFMSLKGSFHGRTDRPSQISDSSLGKYKKHLKSFKERDNLITVTPNDVAELEQTFAACDRDGIWIEAMFMEPVMGEGDPGKAITTEFYQAARKLTKERDTLLIVDSIQAGIRSHGCLSITDYPGFSELDAPDMETYSKALNAGQYPLSVLALSSKTAELYVTGVYGNTMTTNPRALSVACAVLNLITPALRQNITEKGRDFLKAFDSLKQEFPDLITKVQGTGLLFSLEVDPKKVQVTGNHGLEMQLRKKGMGVIHGGENSLRFTPHFNITSAEINLITDLLREQFKNL